MLHRLRKGLVLCLIACLLFQNSALTAAANTGAVPAAFTDSKEKTLWGGNTNGEPLETGEKTMEEFAESPGSAGYAAADTKESEKEQAAEKPESIETGVPALSEEENDAEPAASAIDKESASPLADGNDSDGSTFSGSGDVKEEAFAAAAGQDKSAVQPRVNNSVNMPEATYNTFILQGKKGEGQKIGDSNKVTILKSNQLIQEDITKNHPEYVSFTPHWISGSSDAVLSTYKGSQDIEHYYGNKDIANHVGILGSQASSGNVVEGKVFLLDSSMRGKLACTYTNVGRYYDRSAKKSYPIDIKAVLVDFTKKNKNTENVKNAAADGVFGGADSGALFAFTGKNGIGVEVAFCDAVQIEYSFYNHETNKPINLKGFARFSDIDAQQGVEFSSQADYFYALTAAKSYLGFSRGVFTSGDAGYVYALSGMPYLDGSGHEVYTLFSGSALTLRYTFSKCSRDDDGGKKNDNGLKQYKVPFINETAHHYSNSTSNGIMRFDARQPYLAEPEIEKTVFNGSDITKEVGSPTKATSNTLEDIQDAFTYKVRTVCPYENASEHHYDSWEIRDTVSPYLSVEQAVVYDGNGTTNEEFTINTQTEQDGSTLVTAIANHPSAQSFYEKNWYDLYITVHVKSKAELEEAGLDFQSLYQSSGANAGRYVLNNKAELSTGTVYSSNEVDTVIPQQVKVRKVNENGDPVGGITFGLFASAGAAAEDALMTAVTDENGEACFKAVSFFDTAEQIGPYFIREMDRGIFENVYLINTNWTFSFRCDDGNPVIYGYGKDETDHTLTDQSKVIEKYSIRVRKKNRETGEFLSGAVFSLYQWSEAAGDYVKLFDLKEVVDASGEILYINGEDVIATEDNLGRFMIKEEQAPYGCFNSKESWTFSSTDACVKDGLFEFSCTTENDRNLTQTGELQIQNDLQKGVLRIEKTDDAGDPVGGAVFTVEAAEDIYAPWQTDGNGIPGAGLEPLVSAGSVCGIMKTDDAGCAVSEPLYIGVYTVRETGGAPDHVLSSERYEVTFVYPEEDTVTVTEEVLKVGNVRMQPAFAVAKLADRTTDENGESVSFDADAGRYTGEKLPGTYREGETIRYGITVTNTGNVDLYAIRLYEDMTKKNEAGQSLTDYVDADRAVFAVPSDGSLITARGEPAEVSLVGESGQILLISHLAVGDSLTVYFEAEVLEDAANVYNLINFVRGTASYDNNADPDGRNLLPVPAENLVDDQGRPLTEDEDRIHLPGTPDDTVTKTADRTSGCVISDGELNGSKVPGIYYENETVRFCICVKNRGTARLKDILVTDVMSEELKQAAEMETAAFYLEDSMVSGDVSEDTVKLITHLGEEITARLVDNTHVMLCEDADPITGEGCLVPGDYVLLYFYMTVADGAANLYDLENTALVNASYFTGETLEPLPEIEDTDRIALPGVPEAKVAKIADHTTGAVLVDGRYQNEKVTGSYENGSTITYTITVTNSGTADLWNVKVKDVMEARLLSALKKNTITFRDGKITTARGDKVKATLQSPQVLMLNRLKAGDSVELFLTAVVKDTVGDLSALKNDVYVTGQYRKGNEQQQLECDENAALSGRTFSLTYHANNGTNEKTEDSETPAAVRTTLHINGNPFVRDGYVFLGWNTKADGTGEDYAPGAVYTMPAQDVHLYARWGTAESSSIKEYTYLLTYHSNNPAARTRTDSETRCLFGTTVTLDANPFVYEGYTFLGWSLSPDDDTDLLRPGASFRMPKKDAHLYAQWKKEKKVTLIYHANIPGRDQSKTDFQTPCASGSKVTIKQCEFERKDWNFLGWSTRTDASEAQILPGERMIVQKDTDLFAVWEKAGNGEAATTYRLWYHGNNGTADRYMDSETPCREGSRVTVDENLFTRPGYAFVGWNTKADGSGKDREEKDTEVMPGKDVHLYACWKPISTVTLTYDANIPDGDEYAGGKPDAGAAGTITRVQDCETPCVPGTDIDIDGNPFRRDGYAFLGWSFSPGGGGELLQPESLYTINRDTTLYAVWTKHCEEYTLLYSSNREPFVWETAPRSPSPAGTPQYLIANPFSERQEFFVGWSLDKEASPDDDTLLKPGALFEQPEKNTVLYAIWKEGESVSLCYDANGGHAVLETAAAVQDGCVFDGETPCMPGALLHIDTPPFERDGYRFVGWSADPLSEQVMLYPGCTLTMPEEDLTLYAVWEAVPDTSFKEDSGKEDNTGTNGFYTPIPVTKLMQDADQINIPGTMDLRIAKKADRTGGVTLQEGRYEGKREPGTYYEGDTVRYNITATNCGTATAYQIVIKELLSEQFKDVLEGKGFTAAPGDVLKTKKGHHVTVARKTENKLCLDCLQPGDAVTVTFEAVVKKDNVKKGTVKNTVIIKGKNRDNVPAGSTKYMKDSDNINLVPKEKVSLAGFSPKTGDDRPFFLILWAAFAGVLAAVVYMRRKYYIK